MNTRAAVDRLDRVSELLDRARLAAVADADELHALLDVSTQTLAEGERLRDVASTGNAPDPGLERAIVRVHACHAALLEVIRAELTRIGQQIATATATRDASARYAPRARGVQAGRLDRVG